MEALPGGMLDASRVYAAAGKHSLMLRGEVLSNDSRHANRGEITRGQGKKCGRSSYASFSFARRSLNAVERNTSYHQDCH